MTLATTGLVHPASFRDPSGFVFEREGTLYRQVAATFAADYDHLLASGLYERLVGERLLVRHEEVDVPPARPGAHRVLRPERVPFVSHPYEWSFGQLKDAARLTLRLQRTALEHGMTLKDASAYNVQLHRGAPVLIDTLSLRRAEDEAPWVAYRQFCQHFLAPLALMSKTDVQLGKLTRVFLDGVPLELCSRLLPWSTRLRPGLLGHIHAHAASQRRHADRPVAPGAVRMSRRALLGLLDSLEMTIEGLAWRPSGTEWADYYQAARSYSASALEDKRRRVLELVGPGPLGVVWDLGANEGAFSRAVAPRADLVVSFDIDPAAVERSWIAVREARDDRVLPLLLDLTNPSPAQGWAHEERASLQDRGPADLVLALALVHHLAIGNNVPLERISAFLAELGRTAVVEFVPRDDPMVQRMLAGREDVFGGYTLEAFEAALSQRFKIDGRAPIEGSSRTLLRLVRA